MKALEKAKLALRKHLLDHKEQVKVELQKMREISNEIDMFSYIENLSSSFAIENLEVYEDKNFDFSFDVIDTYKIIKDFEYCSEWYLPNNNILIKDKKKDSDNLSESFFFNIFELWNNYKKQHFHLNNSKYINFHIMRIMIMDPI